MAIPLMMQQTTIDSTREISFSVFPIVKVKITASNTIPAALKKFSIKIEIMFYSGEQDYEQFKLIYPHSFLYKEMSLL